MQVLGETKTFRAKKKSRDQTNENIREFLGWEIKSDSVEDLLMFHYIERVCACVNESPCDVFAILSRKLANYIDRLRNGNETIEVDFCKFITFKHSNWRVKRGFYL